ncbi:receptor-type tyrosine-protein phosphatase eta-like [Gastrophryne carolinensis]
MEEQSALRSSILHLDRNTFPAPVVDFNVAAIKNSTSLLLTWTCPTGDFDNFNFTLAANDIFTITVPQSCVFSTQSYILTGLKPSTTYTITARTLSCARASKEVKVQSQTSITPPPIPTAVLPVVEAPSYNQFQFTFQEFDSTNGPLEAYAVIVSSTPGLTDLQNYLSKTYSDFKNKKSPAYVATIIFNESRRRRAAATGTKTAVIGGGSKIFGYENGPLEPLSSYWFAIAGFTNIAYDNDTKTIDIHSSLFSCTPFVTSVTTPQNPGVIIGAVVGTLLALLVIGVVAGVFIWRRRRMGKNDAQEAPSKLSVRANQAMSTLNFVRHFEKQKADSNLGFFGEYEKLGQVGNKQSKIAAEHPDNREKNRYTNVLPYDISRVTLSSNGNLSDGYINANFIPGYSSSKEFIAAQGPLPTTVNDFWRMIWEKDVRAIVMLTRCIEVGKVKCEEYWPSGSMKVYGNLSVSMSNETSLPDWTIRDLLVTDIRMKQSKQVRHFHFTAWPDHGVPNSTENLIRFRNLVREFTDTCPPTSPILVHCSAGVGRTGTFIGLDRLMKQISTEDKIDVYGVVHSLRMHRCLMVQTDSQYVFLNQCALDVIKRQKQNPDLIYQNATAIYENFTQTQRTNM